MTDPHGFEDGGREGEAVRALLKRALGPTEAPSLWPGIQRRLRRRSRGKLFPDGWGMTQTRMSYLLVGLLTLAIVLLAYFLLGPFASR